MAAENKLKELREKSRYTAAYVADYLGITRQQMYLYEQGKCNLPLRHVGKLARLYEVSKEEVLDAACPEDKREEGR